MSNGNNWTAGFCRIRGLSDIMEFSPSRSSSSWYHSGLVQEQIEIVVDRLRLFHFFEQFFVLSVLIFTYSVHSLANAVLWDCILRAHKIPVLILTNRRGKTKLVRAYIYAGHCMHEEPFVNFRWRTLYNSYNNYYYNNYNYYTMGGRLAGFKVVDDEALHLQFSWNWKWGKKNVVLHML